MSRDTHTPYVDTLARLRAYLVRNEAPAFVEALDDLTATARDKQRCYTLAEMQQVREDGRRLARRVAELERERRDLIYNRDRYRERVAELEAALETIERVDEVEFPVAGWQAEIARRALAGDGGGA